MPMQDGNARLYKANDRYMSLGLVHKYKEIWEGVNIWRVELQEGV